MLLIIKPTQKPSQEEGWTDFVDEDDNTFVVSSNLDSPSLADKESEISDKKDQEPFIPNSSNDWSSYPAQNEPTIQATPHDVVESTKRREQSFR
jgi:hypothetical protein